MEVAEYSEVPNTPNDFLKSDLCERSINIILFLEWIESAEWYDYLYSIILLIEILSACFMLVGCTVFWCITERNTKSTKKWVKKKKESSGIKIFFSS